MNCIAIVTLYKYNWLKFPFKICFVVLIYGYILDIKEIHIHGFLGNIVRLMSMYALF